MESCHAIETRFAKKLHTWPPDNSKTANFPSEMAFNPVFHHLSLSSRVRSSSVDTQLSGTGSIAAAGSPTSAIRLKFNENWLSRLKKRKHEMRKIPTLRTKRTSNNSIYPGKIQTLKKSIDNHVTLAHCRIRKEKQQLISSVMQD